MTMSDFHQWSGRLAIASIVGLLVLGNTVAWQRLPRPLAMAITLLTFFFIGMLLFDASKP